MVRWGKPKSYVSAQRKNKISCLNCEEENDAKNKTWKMGRWVVSLIKFKDHSFVVILGTILGSIAILILIMEVVEAIMWSSAH